MNGTRNNAIRWLALIAAVALLGLAVSFPRRTRTEPLQVALGVWPGSETLIVARERGMLPRSRVQLIDFPWPSAAMRALGNRVVDAAVLSLDEVLRLREPGREVRVVTVLDVSEGADALIGSGRAGTLADLRGKKIGVDVRSSGMVLLETALKTVGLSSADIEVVPLSPSEAEAAVAEQRVDAVVVSEPWATRIQRSGPRVLFDSRHLNAPLYRVLVALADGVTVAEQRAELELLIRSHFEVAEGMDSLASNPSWQVALRREGLSLTEFQQCLLRVKILDRAASLRLMRDGGELEVQSAATERFMHEAGLLEGRTQKSRWLDSSLLEGIP